MNNADDNQGDFIRRGYGSSKRLPNIDFVVFGLITFWIYTVYKIHKHLHEHLSARWMELSDSDVVDDLRGSALYRRGFIAPGRALLISGMLYFIDAMLVFGWFIGFIVSGVIPEYYFGMILIGVSSLIFFLATVVLFVTVTNTLKSHEVAEGILRSLGSAAFKHHELTPSDELLSRWEKMQGNMTLFLVVAIPLTFFPVIGAHFALVGDPTIMVSISGAVCFVFAAIFHVWGTSLLVGIFNNHLQYEVQTLSKDTQPLVSESVSTLSQDIPTGSSDEARRELMAIMLTDIVGYSKAMERDEKSAYDKLLEHNRIVRTEINNHRGREIKTIGDAFLVVFSSALDAVDCAIAIQRSLAEYNQEKAEHDKIMIRIGVHVGDVLLTENDVYGDGVNVAARIEPLAEPGGVCVSNEVYSLVKKKIELDIEHVEDAKMKNIKLAPDVYRIRLSMGG